MCRFVKDSDTTTINNQDLNTSHVSVRALLPLKCQCQCLEPNLNTSHVSVRDIDKEMVALANKFKYISCVGSCIAMAINAPMKGYLNTSHVSVRVCIS